MQAYIYAQRSNTLMLSSLTYVMTDEMSLCYMRSAYTEYFVTFYCFAFQRLNSLTA